MSLTLNKKLLTEFEYGINTIDPENGSIPIDILGFGEISLVFKLKDEEDVAYKRLPIFDNEEQVKRHIIAYNIYQSELLEKRIGLKLLPFGSEYVIKPDGTITLFLAQKKINPQSICHKLLHKLPNKEVSKLYELLMRELHKVFNYNKSHGALSVGIDAQISNWAIKNFNPDSIELSDDTEFYYLDTSTPMFRKNKKEAMEAELFLKSAPSFLRTLLKLLFVQEVLDRYHDWRLVVIDMIANLFKEQRPDAIPFCIKAVNTYFENEAKEFNITPIEFKEVKAYYDEDKMIWDIFLKARKFDRFIQHRVMKKQYEFYLPPDIER